MRFNTFATLAAQAHEGGTRQTADDEGVSGIVKLSRRLISDNPGGLRLLMGVRDGSGPRVINGCRSVHKS